MGHCLFVYPNIRMEKEEMKHKGLLGMMLLLIIIVLATFVSEKQETRKQEQDRETKTVGILQYVSHPALDEIYRGIQDGLAEKGFESEKNLKIEFQNGQADQSKLNMMSQYLLNKKSDILVGIATPAAQALANNTTDTPIVLGAITDPQAAHLVADNQKPGGNITGVSDQSPVDAQLDLAKKIMPTLKKVGVLYSSAEDNSEAQASRVVAEGRKRGLLVKKYPVPSSNQISQMVQVMSSEVDLIYLPTDNTIANAMQIVVDIATKNNIPIMPSVDTMVAQGGLATVGINQYELGVQTGKMTADILRNDSQPATTPIYTFTKGDVVINKEQAKKLGIKIPDDLLKSASKTK